MTEDDTFRKLKRVPFLDACQQIFGDGSYLTMMYSHGEDELQEILAKSLPTVGWTYKEFMEEAHSLHMDHIANFTTKYKAKVEKNREYGKL